MSLTHLIPSLEPKLRDLYDKHRERAAKIDWAYHEYLPLDQLKANPDSIPKLSPIVYTAVETALFTEVNLPWFTTHLYECFKGSIAVMLDFLHTWTAEEDGHALLLETYLLLGGNGDARLRAAMRKNIIRQGWAANIETHFGAIAYTAIQELATQTFYLRIADIAEGEDAMLARALRRLAKDETLHMAFYRDAVKAHLEVEPNYVYPLADVIMKFEMPGSGMPNYLERTEMLAREANYGPSEYYTQVLDYLWKYWGIDELQPSLAEAREAQNRVTKYHAKLGRIAARLASRRDRSADEQLIPAK
ncbi:MAG: acyl-ACP desaturase [Chloroflexota bacterium]